MRHNKKFNHLGRKSAHRKAMLYKHGRLTHSAQADINNCCKSESSAYVC